MSTILRKNKLKGLADLDGSRIKQVSRKLTMMDEYDYLFSI